MRLIGNLLWLVFGGLWGALHWYLAGLLAASSIVGLPWARSCFMLGNFTLWPFGREVVDRRLLGRRDIGTGKLGFVGNVIWFLVVGWSLAVSHLALAGVCAVTIIGIPFALQHLKLAVASLAPVGKEVVDLS